MTIRILKPANYIKHKPNIVTTEHYLRVYLSIYHPEQFMDIIVDSRSATIYNLLRFKDICAYTLTSTAAYQYYSVTVIKTDDETIRGKPGHFSKLSLLNYKNTTI